MFANFGCSICNTKDQIFQGSRHFMTLGGYKARLPLTCACLWVQVHPYGHQECKQTLMSSSFAIWMSSLYWTLHCKGEIHPKLTWSRMQNWNDLSNFFIFRYFCNFWVLVLSPTVLSKETSQVECPNLFLPPKHKRAKPNHLEKNAFFVMTTTWLIGRAQPTEPQTSNSVLRDVCEQDLCHAALSRYKTWLV